MRVTNLNLGEACTGPGFCPSRVKSIHFSSGFAALLHRTRTQSAHVCACLCVAPFKGNNSLHHEAHPLWGTLETAVLIFFLWAQNRLTLHLYPHVPQWNIIMSYGVVFFSFFIFCWVIRQPSHRVTLNKFHFRLTLFTARWIQRDEPL